MIDVTRPLAEARKGLLRRLADPWALLAWVAVPLVIGSLVTLISGGGGPPKARLLVADLDQSIVSSLVVSALTREELADLLDAETVSLDEGRGRMDRGEASGLLILPEGFGERFLREEPERLELLTHPGQRVLPEILEEILDLLVEVGFYVHRVFGDELGRIEAGSALDDASFAELAVGIRDKMEKIVPAFGEPRIPLEIVRPRSTAETVDFSLLFFPGIALMAVFFAAEGLASELWDERELGILRRSAASPGGAGSLLGGKLLAVAGVQFLIALVILVPGFLFHRLPWVLFGPSSLWLALSGVILYLLMALIQLLAPSRRAGHLISQMVLFPLLMIGGSFFPSEALPDSLAAVGTLTPNGFMTNRLEALLLQGSFPSLLPSLAVLLLSAALLYAAARSRLRSFSRF